MKIKTLLVVVLITTSSLTKTENLTQFITEEKLKTIAAEVSGVSAKRNLDKVALYHRMRASNEFNEAAAHIYSELKSYGYNTAEIMRFPADGKTLFGTQKSRLAWNVDFAELWELDKDNNRVRRLADWQARPMTVAQDSDSTDVVASLVDIGTGTSASDYEGKTVKGKIVLTSSQPGAVEQLAILERGALGVISYAANQKSAWWQLDDSLVRWGHLSSFREYPTFGFMITLAEARMLKSRLAQGEEIRFHAKIDSRREVGEYQIVSALIEGVDPKLKQEEIIFSCHLDHPRPGANDNASGCVSILEVARSLKALIDSGQLQTPKRSIRFIWPAEIEATLIFLNQKAQIAENIRHNIHMDMVGGGPVTKAVFRLSRGPSSVADITGEIAYSIVDFVNQHTLDYASGDDTPFKLTSTEGGREPLLAEKEWISMGSDHDIFASGSWSITTTYLHDWPDRYIHTTKDLVANIDPTKLKRSAFIGLLQAIIVASLGDEHAEKLTYLLNARIIERTGKLLTQGTDVKLQDAVMQGHWANEQQIAQSILAYAPKANLESVNETITSLKRLSDFKPNEGNTKIYHRNEKIKGTMNGFGYSFIEDKLDSSLMQSLELRKSSSGRQKAYETLNLVDGKNTLQDIHSRLTYQFGETSIKAIEKYLEALKTIDIIK